LIVHSDKEEVTVRNRSTCGFIILLLIGGCASPPDRKVAAPVLTLVKTDVTLQGVTLKWGIEESVAEDEVAGGIVRFGMERKAVGSDSWTTLNNGLTAGDVEYTDVTFAPKTSYTYRLTFHFAPIGSGTPPDPDEMGSITLISSLIRTHPIWNLEAISVMKNQVYLEIEKFDRELGQKVKKKHLHRPGVHIGWWKESGSAVAVSTHRVTLGGGKTATVDFNTGMTLVSVEKKPAMIEVKQCMATLGADGESVVCKQSEVIMVIKNGYEIVTKDEDGRHLFRYPDPVNNPILKRGHCTEHGGEKDFRRSVKLDESQELLAEADRIWSTDPEKSILIYRRLLNEFGESDAVRRSRTRIRLRAEQGD